MLPELSLFGLRIPVYGLISFFGLMFTLFAGLLIIRKGNISRNQFLSLAAVSAFGVIAGANFLYALTRIEDIAELFKEFSGFDSFLDFNRELFAVSSGMVFYGGLYGGLLAGLWWAKYKKYPIKDTADVFSVLIPLFHTFGRVGCFFAGCCYGIRSQWGVSGIVITADVRESAKRVPVQLIEAALVFCLFLALVLLYYRQCAKGYLICVYLSVYAVIRFVLEFFRGDEIRGYFLWFSTSQWISIFTVFSLIIYLIGHKNTKQKSKD